MAIGIIWAGPSGWCATEGKMHRGLDLAMVVGTALYLPYDGGIVERVVSQYQPDQYAKGRLASLGNYQKVALLL